MPSRRLVAAAGVAALTVLLGGCSTTGADEPTRGANQQGYVGVAQNVTRIAPADRVPLATVSGTALGSATTVSSADFAGKVVVLNVWGSWCPPCRQEAAGLQTASEKTKGKAQFLGIDVQETGPANAEAFVRAKGITYPSIYDPSSKTLLDLAGQLAPDAIPSTLVIDAQGRLAVRVLGSISAITLVDMINDTAAGT